MRVVKWMLAGALFVIVLGFVLLNWRMVTVNFFGFFWRWPVSLMVIASLLIGLLVGFGLGLLSRKRRSV